MQAAAWLLLSAAGAAQTPPASSAPPGPLERPVLLIIDVQNFYFEGGTLPLAGSVKASLQAKTLLESFRAKNLPVIHVAHMPKEKPAAPDPLYSFHSNVAPRPGEAVVIKHYADAFRETDLLDRLRALRAETLVICGMQTHMCVEAAVRHAADTGFRVVLAEDACATRDLKYKRTTVPAASVQAAVLAALNGTYAKIAAAAEIAAALK
jgi:Amidases related to nicotinamidase